MAECRRHRRQPGSQHHSVQLLNHSTQIESSTVHYSAHHQPRRRMGRHQRLQASRQEKAWWQETGTRLLKAKQMQQAECRTVHTQLDIRYHSVPRKRHRSPTESSIGRCTARLHWQGRKDRRQRAPGLGQALVWELPSLHHPSKHRTLDGSPWKACRRSNRCHKRPCESSRSYLDSFHASGRTVAVQTQ